MCRNASTVRSTRFSSVFDIGERSAGGYCSCKRACAEHLKEYLATLRFPLPILEVQDVPTEMLRCVHRRRHDIVTDGKRLTLKNLVFKEAPRLHLHR